MHEWMSVRARVCVHVLCYLQKKNEKENRRRNINAAKYNEQFQFFAWDMGFSWICVAKNEAKQHELLCCVCLLYDVQLALW